MRTKTLMVVLATLLTGSLCFWACQKDEIVSEEPDTTEHIAHTAGQYTTDCHTLCIDPDNPVYYEKTQQEVITWGNPRNPHAKTVDIVYCNTLEAFIIKVTSSEDIANLLIDEISYKDFSNPIPAGTWYELELPLPEGWESCDEYSLEFSVIGSGPPAVFDVIYELVGECIYYSLDLAVYPEGAGSVAGAGEYLEGEEVQLTATANEDWKFVNWTDEHGDEISGIAEFIYPMPAFDVVLTANFQEEDEASGFTCGYNITFTYLGEEVTYRTIEHGGLCWLDRNLGADPMPFVPADDATGKTDQRLYGDLFQWGRLDDGHQVRTSNTTPGPIDQDVPGHGDFIAIDSGLLWDWDWRSPKNNALWQGEDGINNPCPPDWRVPTEAELNAERLSWGSQNAAGAYASILTWPLSGYRGYTGSLHNEGTSSHVWSSSVSVDGDLTERLLFSDVSAIVSSSWRAGGMSVRCVRDIVHTEDD